jgi:hypothetical protein
LPSALKAVGAAKEANNKAAANIMSVFFTVVIPFKSELTVIMSEKRSYPALAPENLDFLKA